VRKSYAEKYEATVGGGRRGEGRERKKERKKRKEDRGTGKNDRGRVVGERGREVSLPAAETQVVVSPTVYGGGVCVAPCVPSSLFLPRPPARRAPHQRVRKKEEAEEEETFPGFFFPRSFSPRPHPSPLILFLPFAESVAMIFPSASKQVAGVFFYGVPFFFL
jgi:hypothetical protein